MIQPRQVAFDIDCVVADTMRLFLDIARQVYGINHIRYSDITAYRLEQCLDIEPDVINAIEDRIINGDYPCRLSPIQGAKNVLQRLGACGPLLFVTARPTPGPMTQWMNDLLPPAQYEVELVATGSFEAKTDVLISRGIRFFVEDRLETCFLLDAHKITPILFSQPWNREPHAFMEVDTWDQLEAMFEFRE